MKLFLKELLTFLHHCEFTKNFTCTPILNNMIFPGASKNLGAPQKNYFQITRKNIQIQKDEYGNTSVN